MLGMDSPPATRYTLSSPFDDTKERGPSFGASYEVYRRVHAPGVNMHADQVPGPGSYDLKTFVGKNARKVSLKGRFKVPNSATRDNPPPNTYKPCFRLVEQSKY